MTIAWQDGAMQQLGELDETVKVGIVNYMDKVEKLPSPLDEGKPISGNRKGQWRYRVGDYRIICKIKDKVVTITVIDAGHRKDIYDW